MKKYAIPKVKDSCPKFENITFCFFVNSVSKALNLVLQQQGDECLRNIIFHKIPTLNFCFDLLFYCQPRFAQMFYMFYWLHRLHLKKSFYPVRLNCKFICNLKSNNLKVMAYLILILILHGAISVTDSLNRTLSLISYCSQGQR